MTATMDAILHAANAAPASLDTLEWIIGEMIVWRGVCAGWIRALLGTVGIG